MLSARDTRLRLRTAREGAPGRLLARGSDRSRRPIRLGRSSGIPVEAFCTRLGVGSERGHRRDDIRPGLRIVGFEHRLTVAFAVDDDIVTVLRVFTAERNWEPSC